MTFVTSANALKAVTTLTTVLIKEVKRPLSDFLPRRLTVIKSSFWDNLTPLLSPASYPHNIGLIFFFEEISTKFLPVNCSIQYWQLLIINSTTFTT